MKNSGRYCYRKNLLCARAHSRSAIVLRGTCVLPGEVDASRVQYERMLYFQILTATVTLTRRPFELLETPAYHQHTLKLTVTTFGLRKFVAASTISYAIRHSGKKTGVTPVVYERTSMSFTLRVGTLLPSLLLDDLMSFSIDHS